MTLKKRRLLWGGFVIVFFLVIPGIIVYTAGWRFDLSKKWFIRSSTLILASYPREAEVVIEGVTKVFSPGWIKFLHPGARRITVTSSGGVRWEKTLPLTPGEVTFAEQVILFSPGQKVYMAPNPGKNHRRALARFDALSEGGMSLVSRERKQPGGNLILRQASPYELVLFHPQTNQTELIQRRSKPIRRAEWFPFLPGLPEKSGWVIFADRNEVIAIEIDNRDQRNTARLATVERIDDFAVTADGLKLFIAGRWEKRDGLFVIPLF